MKASIVIPAHNEEKYIASTLEAALAQTYPDFEVIVVNNNSTDSTVEIVKKYPKVRLIDEYNKGTQFARERGRKEALGDIIAFIDADCLPEPTWLSRASIWLTKGVGGVSGPYDYWDNSKISRLISLWFQKIFYKPTSVVLQLFKVGGIIIFGNFVARKDALEKMGGFNTLFVFYGDDTDVAKRLTKVAPIVFDNKLVMKSSARRFKKQGFIQTFFLYIVNFFSVLTTGKPHPGNPL